MFETNAASISRQWNQWHHWFHFQTNISIWFEKGRIEELGVRMIVLVLMFCCDVHIGCAGSTKNWQHCCVASVIFDFYLKIARLLLTCSGSQRVQCTYMFTNTLNPMVAMPINSCPCFCWWPKHNDELRMYKLIGKNVPVCSVGHEHKPTQQKNIDYVICSFNFYSSCLPDMPLLYCNRTWNECRQIQILQEIQMVKKHQQTHWRSHSFRPLARIGSQQSGLAHERLG